MPSKAKSICPAAFDWLFAHADRKLMLQRLAKPTSKEMKAFLGIVTLGGFKLSAETIDRQKNRIYTGLLRAEALIPLFLSFVSDSRGPWQEAAAFIAGEEELARRKWRKALEAAAQPGIIVVALASCPPESWQRRLARRLLKIDSVWTDDHGPAAACAAISEACRIFSVDIQPPKPQEDESAIAEKLAREYRRGRQDERQDQERQSAAERRAWEAKLREAQRNTEAALRERDAANATVKATLNGEAARLAEQKTRLESHFQSTLDALLEQWFLTDRRLENDAAASQLETSSLLARLASATERQLAYSRDHGSKSALREQKRALAQALEKLQRAADDAVVAIDGIPALMAEANRQIRQIESRLKDDDIPSLAFSQIAAVIDAVKLDSQSAQLFDASRQFIRQACEHDILSDDEAARLEKRIVTRLDIQKNGAFSTIVEKDIARKTESHRPKITREIWNIMQYAQELPRVTLLIDGYNAMMRNDFWCQMTRLRSFDEARRHFTERCRLKAPRFQAIHLVFDGTGSIVTHEKPAANMLLTFAPRVNDAHNADDCIVARAQNLKETGSADLLWAVTNDYDLRERLEDTCDAFVETRAIPQFFLQ